MLRLRRTIKNPQVCKFVHSRTFGAAHSHRCFVTLNPNQSIHGSSWRKRGIYRFFIPSSFALYPSPFLTHSCDTRHVRRRSCLTNSIHTPNSKSPEVRGSIILREKTNFKTKEHTALEIHISERFLPIDNTGNVGLNCIILCDFSVLVCLKDAAGN